MYIWDVTRLHCTKWSLSNRTNDNYNETHRPLLVNWGPDYQLMKWNTLFLSVSQYVVHLKHLWLIKNQTRSIKDGIMMVHFNDRYIYNICIDWALSVTISFTQNSIHPQHLWRPKSQRRSIEDDIMSMVHFWNW